VGAELRIHNADQTAHDVRIVKGDRPVLKQTLNAGARDLSKADLATETGVLRWKAASIRGWRRSSP
jgi:hypothetical protein